MCYTSTAKTKTGNIGAGNGSGMTIRIYSRTSKKGEFYIAADHLLCGIFFNFRWLDYIDNEPRICYGLKVEKF
jgi:hypothetical protein